MSSEKPSFLQSLVAYGSSPETSDDEDVGNASDQDVKLTSGTADTVSKVPDESLHLSKDFDDPVDHSSESKLISQNDEAQVKSSNCSEIASIAEVNDDNDDSVNNVPLSINLGEDDSAGQPPPTIPDLPSNVNLPSGTNADDTSQVCTVRLEKLNEPVQLGSTITTESDLQDSVSYPKPTFCLPGADENAGNSHDTLVPLENTSEIIAEETPINVSQGLTHSKGMLAVDRGLIMDNTEAASFPEESNQSEVEKLSKSFAEAEATSEPRDLGSCFSEEAVSEDGKIISDDPRLEKVHTNSSGGRRLRQVRHPSAKAAEAAADAAFVAAVTPSRKNIKEAKIACALAKVSDTGETSTKKTSSKEKKGGSSSVETGNRNTSSSPVVFSAKEDSCSSEKSNADIEEGRLSSVGDGKRSSSDYDEEEEDEDGGSESELFQHGGTNVTDVEKPIGIKLKISRESVQILDPPLSKLEVQIPSETNASEILSSPGGSKRIRKLKEGTPSPIPPLSPITLKIAKSKEGLEVVPNETVSNSDSEVGKIEKITLKLSRDEGATIVKPNVDETAECRQEKLTLKLCKDDSASGHRVITSYHQDDPEEAKREKITLKLSKRESACTVKKKETDSAACSSDNDSGKLEKITLKLSNDKNVSIVRPKDVASPLERSSSASPEPGKIEKITLKVSKNDNVSIVKPASPTPTAVGVEKLTLKVCKDGTAAVSGRQHDDTVREGESSKLEKITLKLSKDEGVSIVKPVSPVPDRKSKFDKDEPLSPLSPLIIARNEESEPQKERITLKLSKAGGHPSPVGVIDERSSWSIKSTDSDNLPSPVTSDPSTPKSRPKRAFSETPEAPNTAKRLKLSEAEKTFDSDLVLVSDNLETPGNEQLDSHLEEEMDTSCGTEQDAPILLDDSKTDGKIETNAKNITEVILLDSEDSQAGASLLTSEANDGSSAMVDIENEIPSSRIMKRKPRGRPRKAVLTPGAIPVATPVNLGDASPTTKVKREKIRPEPVECDRPKRSCKGREKPPPKPPKPVKPRGKAALAKLKAEQSMQPEGPQLFEEETRMSADCTSQSQTLTLDSTLSVSGNSTSGLVAKVVIPKLPGSQHSSFPTTPSETPAPSPGPVIVNEESQGSVSMISSTTTESTPNRGNRKGRMEINVDPDAQTEFTVDMIAEYMWPLNDGNGETYMIQEQISTFLGVKSFKRKYPNMQRRAVDHDERQYLLERRLVSESLCDLGLTALPSHEVLDVLCTDFPEKYEEYRRHVREKVQRELSNKQKALLPGVTFGKEDSKSKAMRNMASFNAMLNRSRRDERRACFDLQSFAVHYPQHRRHKMTVPNPPRIGAYPLALVPGQFTDYYKEYTPTEIRYFPLNTVLYGPLLPHEMMKSHITGGSDGSQTETSDSSSSDSSSSDSDTSGSDSDSDSDSSSGSEDDASNQTLPGTADNQETEIDRPDAVCRVCNGDRLKNKLGKPESLIHCASCGKSGHLSCLELTLDMFPYIRKYSWHCTDCKLCAQCNDTADEDKMLFCDMCDRGYHIYCVGLRKVPEGRWHCQECAICASCGARDPGGSEEHQATTQAPQDTPTKSDIPQWQHEFKKGDKGGRIYVRTLCVPCSKLWKKGRYCRLCWKCYSNQPEEEGLINCSICDRWMHADCCRKAGRVIDVEKLGSYMCELCQQKGVRVVVNKLQLPLKAYR